MELVEFYRALLPAHGFYSLWFKGNKGHYWADSIDEFVALTQKKLSSGVPDWYFATAAFDEKSRKQEHVSAKRCLYIDLDAGPEKLAKHGPEEVYATQRDAIADVVRFSKEMSLPPSMIVSSGAGLHVYYALDQDITEGEWRPLAEALGAACRLRGMKVDASCTTDSARLLRPLGAAHSNGQTVTLLKATGRAYSPDELRSKFAVEEPEQFALTAQPRAKLKVNDQLGLWESAPVSALKVAEKCAALREIAAVKGDVPEPKWRAMIGLVKFTVEGVDQAHEWSCGHSEYDPADTEAKYDAYVGTGPTLCDTFGRHSTACDTCPHKGKIKSPIQLGRMNIEQVAALPPEKQSPPPITAAPKGSPFESVEFGDGYRAADAGGAWVLEARKVVESKDEDGKTVRDFVWVRISDEVFWLDGWSEAGSHDSDSAMVTLNLYSNATKSVRSWPMQSSALATSNDLFKWLSGHQITRSTVDQTVGHLMHNYVNKQFSLVRRAAPRLAVRGRFGIQFDGDGPDAKLICCQGRYIIRGDGTIEEAVLGRDLIGHRDLLTIRPLAGSVAGRWEPGVWKSVIGPGAKSHVDFLRKYYLRPGFEVAQLATMLSLSSPLMVFAADTTISPGSDLPPVGLTVSLYSSSSGQGKTSMQKVIASAYGDPSAMVRSGSRNDATITSQSAFASLMGTMPLFLDEVTQNQPSEVVELVNRISMGQDKNRGNRAGAYRSMKPWALIGSVSTNVPQRELLGAYQKASDALQMRVLELTCEFPMGEQDAHVEFERDRDQMIGPYYGCLGALINLLIVRAGAEEMRKRVMACFEEAANVIQGSTQRERFFQRGMACVLACHDLLGGLAPFNRDTLKLLYSRVVREAGDYVTSVRRTPADLMRRMISDMSPHIVVTYGEGINKLEIVRNMQQLRAPYCGRRIENTGVIFLLSDSIKEWARDNQVSYGDLIARARKEEFLVPITGDDAPNAKRLTITRGTDLSTVNGLCYAFDERKLFSEEAGMVLTTQSHLRVVK